MRIIGGMAGGLILKVPKGLAVRPTPDLVRQAVFNSLGHRVEQAKILDLFAGSGAIGLECLSRGAALVVSVEKTQRHAAIIRQNLASARLPADRFELRVQDVFTALPQLLAGHWQFELILADPPFGDKNPGRRSESVSQHLLDDPNLPQLLAGSGLFVLGHASRDQVTIPSNWEEVKALKHGDSTMRFLARKESSPD